MNPYNEKYPVADGTHSNKFGESFSTNNRRCSHYNPKEQYQHYEPSQPTT